jgi:hypothetical protein
MTEWVVLLAHSPLNTAGGTSGLLGPLKLATGVSVDFNLDDHDTLTFTLPGDHYQTGYVRAGVTDVILERDGVTVQRFRVMSRKFDASGPNFTCSVTAWSYRAVLDEWIFHSTDKLDYETVSETDPTAEQSAIAWNIVNEGQAKAHGNLNVSRGITPSVPVYRQLYIEDVSDGAPQHYFSVAQPRGSEIQSKIASLEDGFEWSIEPDPAKPRTHLKFNTWNVGHRNYHSGGISPLLLSPATMESWSIDETMDEYANVIRVVGSTATDVVGGEGPEAWRPVSESPAGSPPEGRWERDVPTDIPTQAEVDAYAAKAIADYTGYTAQWSIKLQPGRWNGPSHLWVGDSARLIVNIPPRDDDGNVIEGAEDVVSINDTLRCIGVQVSISSTGTEDVSLTINKTKRDFLTYVRRLSDRLASIERR